MNANDFVRKLAETAPSIADLKRAGLSETDARMIHEKGHFCRKRKAPLPIDNSNEIMSLMKYWHASDVEVGMVQFLDMPVETERGIHVADMEADPLIISKADGELFVEELGTDGHVLWEAAISPAHFLDALIVGAKFNEGRVTHRIDYEDFAVARRAAQECALLAGGPKYSDFYLMFLGAEE